MSLVIVELTEPVGDVPAGSRLRLFARGPDTPTGTVQFEGVVYGRPGTILMVTADKFRLVELRSR